MLAVRNKVGREREVKEFRSIKFRIAERRGYVVCVRKTWR